MTSRGRAPLSVAVLAFDEADNIGPVLEELRTWLDVHEPDAEIVVVDDGSRDNTPERARRAVANCNAQVVQHSTNRGIGAALKTATTVARHQWVTFLPADGQVPPEAVGRLRAAAQEGNVDLVFSVYETRNDGWHRTLLSWGVRALIALVHGVRLESDGPYLFRRRLLEPRQLPPDSFFLNFELPIRAMAAGLRIRTVTVPCRPRWSGQSKSAGLRQMAQVARDLWTLRVRRTRGAWARALGRADDRGLG